MSKLGRCIMKKRRKKEGSEGRVQYTKGIGKVILNWNNLEGT